MTSKFVRGNVLNLITNEVTARMVEVTAVSMSADGKALYTVCDAQSQYSLSAQFTRLASESELHSFGFVS